METRHPRLYSRTRRRLQIYLIIVIPLRRFLNELEAPRQHRVISTIFISRHEKNTEGDYVVLFGLLVMLFSFVLLFFFIKENEKDFCHAQERRKKKQKENSIERYTRKE
eukprot:PhF_6_TR42934/c1_g2_i2/m.65189